MTIGTGIAVAGVALAVAALGIFAPEEAAIGIVGICAFVAVIVVPIWLFADTCD